MTDGTEVLVTRVADASGSSAAVLAAVESSPPIPTEWVDELEQLIAEGRQPASRPDLFADEPGGPERP